jgi:hypothetical protein
MGDDLHINKQTNICIAIHTIHLSVFCRTNSPSTDQSRAEGNNKECVGKKRFNGRVLPMGFGKSMCYVPLFWTRYYIFYFQKPLYKSLHQSFFYSFITILPSESGATLHYSTILP